MTPIRALFFLAAITAACAGRIPGQVEDADFLQTQIALLSRQSLTGNPFANIIEKIEEMWAAMEEKSGPCIADFKTEIMKVLGEFKNTTQTCAASQVASVMDIRNQAIAIITVLEDVTSEVVPKLRDCFNAEPTPGPTPRPTPGPNPPHLLELNSWSGFWAKAECVADELAAAANEFSDIPNDVAKIVSDFGDLNSKETLETLEKCVKDGLAGKGTEVQQAVADLAYCVIAPKQQQ